MEHQIASQEAWIEARRALLLKEKELTRLRDQLSAERRELPWVRIDKKYAFEGPNGTEGLADLFAGRSQLVIKHFMLGPGWKDTCVGCSFESDHIDGVVVHLEHHDVSYVAVSRAPYPEIAAVQQRMGWRFKWLSSFGGDFNYDFNVSFTPEQIAAGKATYNYRAGATPMEEMSGRSVFYKDETGAVFHTYSSFARGGEVMLSTYALLDMTPKGRNEKSNLADWVKLHDRYEPAAESEAECCR
jgi:predicted dithiol-disulfide oxidoreductase (DUF899 family)